MSWREYYAIVSKEHLYLYNNRQELRENSKILMKNARVIIKGDTDDTLEL
jgi:divalent metal cation (Fe/Co/Zn/Cd) transporter